MPKWLPVESRSWAKTNPSGVVVVGTTVLAPSDSALASVAGTSATVT
jgi:hypothetical protein